MHLDTNMCIYMKDSAPSCAHVATNKDTPKGTDTEDTFTDTKDTCTDMKDTHMNTRESTANGARIDIEESVPVLLLSAIMNSPAKPAHKYVIRQALRPRSKIID